MRTVLAELALIAFVLLGIAYASGVFTSSTSAVSKAELMVMVKPVYTSQGTYLDVSLKNLGGAAAKIVNVTIDGVDVTKSLGWGGVELQPGGELRKTIQVTLPPGAHVLTITYVDGGQVKTTSFQFTT